LKGVQVVFGTQAHLERSPNFINQITQWSEAKRILVMLDETNFIMKPFRRHFTKKHLNLFLDVLNRLNPNKWGKSHQRWRYLTNLLLQAPTQDLRSHEWKMPWISFEWSIAVQSCGYHVHGESFHFIAFDMEHFSRSPLDSRERAANGDVLYASVPYVKGDFIIYSGSADNDFTQFRMGSEFANPFKEYSFEHPETVWYNIASRSGAKIYFLKNSAQILDFFAALAARRLGEGKRPLLIAKKCFVSLCAEQMENRLRTFGLNEAKVVINGWRKDMIDDPLAIPLIHYGMIGTNLFEEFDCAYCLTGYYVTEEAINGILQDVRASDLCIPIRLSFEGRPCRRTAGALNAADRIYDIHRFAQQALNHQEMEVVLQAVGRIRPYTKPREVITFQCAEHPKLEYTRLV
jgi:hypothetical protein